MHYTELDTPALIIDVDVLEKNVRDMQADCDRLGIGLRAHTKTHKTPAIARMQIKAGAVGICCQKLGEAEVMADTGIEDILISYNIVGPAKLGRLTRLVRKKISSITVVADSSIVVDGLARQAAKDNCTIRVMVEMDTGGRRCGAPTPKATLALTQRIDRLPGLEFAGAMFYKGTHTAGPYIDEARNLLDTAGLPLPIVSGGGTGAQAKCKALGCTEARIGSYAYEGMTRTNRREQLCPDRNPVRVVVTVVSANRSGDVVADAGQKSFTSYPSTPYGYCIEHPEIYLEKMSVEHGHVNTSELTRKLEVGTVISFIPQHGGMTTNLYDRMYAVRGTEVVEEWVIAGRGKAQ